MCHAFYSTKNIAAPFSCRQAIFRLLYNIFPDLPDICLNQPERILCAIPMASLISMGCVDARPNQGMAHVMACFQGSLNIRTVMRIHIHDIADSSGVRPEA